LVYRNNAEEKLMKTIAQHQEEIMDRTDEIVVGAEYWLSSFHDVDGAYVKVLNKSKEENGAGWNSTVTVKVVTVDSTYPHHETYYAAGTIHTCNATNLYDLRHESSHTHKYRKQDWAVNPCACA
jgi:hypothetical protein|tara:strand:+ start:114 stop:485 length:372 start_codon:yes stop_codon:yes gene_type:complete